MTLKRRGILTAGTWCVDRNKLITHWPDEDGLAETLDESSSGGGSACNLAIDVKKLDPDLPVATMGLIGDDADGRLLMAEADRYRIGRAQMTISDQAPTHYTDAFASKKTGRRTHITNLGVSVYLTPDHLDVSTSPHRFLHLGIVGVHQAMDDPWGEEPNGWTAVLKAARATGLETSLELAGSEPAKLAAITRPCLPHLDLLIVNDHEIGAITDTATIKEGRSDPAACIEAAEKALALGSSRLVAVHFPNGAIVCTREGQVIQRPSLQIPEDIIVGANGAGDAFAAGFLYGLHEAWSIDDALALAHAAAATSLRHMSTSEALEPWQTCLDLAESWGWRSAFS